jgi:acetyl-CoA synthetase
VWAFWVRRAGDAASDAGVASRLRAAVATGLGKPFVPARVVRVDALPKTRSAKILRRAVRAAVLDTDPGDLSGAENPGVVDDIRARVREA